MIDLFEQQLDSSKNRLPYNGEVYFYGQLLSLEDTEAYYQWLLEEVKWESDKAVLYGKHIVTKRKVAWYGDKSYKYAYSGVIRTAMPWIDVVIELKRLVEDKTGEQYNSCLLNLYHDGTEGMAWHSDDERELKKGGSIASLSLGTTRKFALKHNKTKEKVEFLLNRGDLLEMRGETQSYWKHAILKTTKVLTPRISLTFRQIEI